MPWSASLVGGCMPDRWKIPDKLFNDTIKISESAVFGSFELLHYNRLLDCVSEPSHFIFLSEIFQLNSSYVSNHFKLKKKRRASVDRWMRRDFNETTFFVAPIFIQINKIDTKFLGIRAILMFIFFKSLTSLALQNHLQ